MRARFVVGTVVLGFLLPLLAVLRRHIHVFLDTGRTSTTFHSYLRTNPDLVFRYPASNHTPRTDGVAVPQPVPKIIHRIFLSDGQPLSRVAQYESTIERCKSLHPAWTVHIWTDWHGEDFMAEHYPELHPSYVGYRQNRQRANILRYALLHHFGGVYLDLDVTCRVALDAPLDDASSFPTLTHLPGLTSGASPVGVHNAFILARPRHPFLATLLAQAPDRDLSWGLSDLENTLSTGSMFFSNAWMSFVRSSHGREVRTEDRMYVLADETGATEPRVLRGKAVTPLFEHEGASSWHGWDAAAAVLLIGKHLGYWACAVALLGVTLVLGSWNSFRRMQRRRQKRPAGGQMWTGAFGRLSLEKHGVDHEESGLRKDG